VPVEPLGLVHAEILARDLAQHGDRGLAHARARGAERLGEMRHGCDLERAESAHAGDRGVRVRAGALPGCADGSQGLWRADPGERGHERTHRAVARLPAQGCDQGIDRVARFEAAQECFSEATELNPRFIEARHHRGKALFELGFFSEAVKSYTISLSLNGEYIPSLIGMGECFREQRDFERAKSFYNKALILDPDNLQAQLAKLRLFIDDSNYEAALEYINEILEKSPDNPELMTDLAQTFYELGLYSETYQMCRDILRHDSNNWRISLLSKCAKNWLAEHRLLMEEILGCTPIVEDDMLRDLNSLFSATCNVQEAKKLLSYLIKRDQTGRAFYLLALVEKLEGNIDDAMKNCQVALFAARGEFPEAETLQKFLRQAGDYRTKFLVDPRALEDGEDTRSAAEWLECGIERFIQKNYQEALTAFQNTLNRDPSLHSAWFFSGRIFEHEGDTAGAKKYYNNFILNCPQSPGFYREMIFNQGGTMEFEALDIAYKRRIGLYPADHRSWMDYIRFLLKNGYHERARILATEIIKAYVDQWLINKDSHEFMLLYGLIQLFLKRYVIARETFQRLLNAAPGNLAASIALAKTMALSGKFQEAEEMYQKIAEKDDLSLMPEYQLAGLYLEKKERKKAFSCINNALERRPNLQELLFRKAEILLRTKEYAECLEICYKLYTKDKEFYYAYILHGRALDAREKSSTEPLTRGISSNPRNIVLLKALALTYLSLGDYLKALAAFDLVLSKNKTDSESMIARGFTYYRTGNYDMALSSFQSAAEINYKNTDVWVLLGITHHRKGHIKVAETLFRQALLLSTTAPSVLVNFGIFLHDQGRLVEAQECAEKILRIDSDYGPAWLLRARCCRTYGNIDEARRSIRSALLFLPEDPMTLTLRGIIEYEAGEFNLSMQSFKKASEMVDEDPIIWYNLAFLAFKDDKFDHSYKWINRALGLKPVFFEALFLKGLCLMEQHKEELARTVFRQASVLEPEKSEKWKKIQSISNDPSAPVKPLELAMEPYFLHHVAEMPLPDPVTIFHLEKPEDVLPLVKDLSGSF